MGTGRIIILTACHERRFSFWYHWRNNKKIRNKTIKILENPSSLRTTCVATFAGGGGGNHIGFLFVSKIETQNHKYRYLSIYK